MSNSGYTLWGNFTALSSSAFISSRGRIYSKETFEKAIKDFLNSMKRKQRKEKLQKLNEKNNT
jgi:hypothetical protein